MLAAIITVEDSRLGVGGRIAQYTYRKRRAGQRLTSGRSRRQLRRASDPLFDGIDHPLRIKQGTTTAYYELDLAGNVRALRASGGADLGKYRFTAFGKTAEDTAGITQPLRWKGRWYSVVGGTEIYDVRARQWAPELGVFLTIDGYRFHDQTSTLWGWPAQNPIRFGDPSGHETCQWCLDRAKATYDKCKEKNKCPPEGVARPGDQCFEPTQAPVDYCKNCDLNHRMDIADCIASRACPEPDKPRK